jgi:hypothetical protein
LVVVATFWYLVRLPAVARLVLAREGVSTDPLLVHAVWKALDPVPTVPLWGENSMMLLLKMHYFLHSLLQLASFQQVIRLPVEQIEKYHLVSILM